VASTVPMGNRSRRALICPRGDPPCVFSAPSPSNLLLAEATSETSPARLYLIGANAACAPRTVLYRPVWHRRTGQAPLQISAATGQCSPFGHSRWSYIVNFSGAGGGRRRASKETSPKGSCILLNVSRIMEVCRGRQSRRACGIALALTAGVPRQGVQRFGAIAPRRQA